MRICCGDDGCPIGPAAVPLAPHRPFLPLELPTKASPLLFHRRLSSNEQLLLRGSPSACQSFSELRCSLKALPTQSILLAPLSTDLHQGLKASLITFVPSLSSTNIFPNKSLACLIPFSHLFS